MRIAILRETAPREQRVALIPEVVARLVRAGHTVSAESGAGERAGFLDAAYADAGATVAASASEALREAQVVARVREPELAEIDAMPEGASLLGLLGRGDDAARMERYKARRLSVFSLHTLPRISRAQKMDALSSMAAVAGYKAVLLAANATGRFFPLLMTAAGTVAPARVFVLGAGVAGLQAIATARRLGAVVEAFDVRPAVAEEVQSLGATFVKLDLGEAGVGAGGYARELDDQRQAQVRQLIASRLAQTDVLITTASIPGRPAPRLVTAEMAAQLKPGSVVVDLAAESGGNCEPTRPGETVVVSGVTYLGPLDIAASLPAHASQMLSRNLLALITHLAGADGQWRLDFADEITRGCCLTHDGRPAPALVPAGTA